MRPSVSAVAPQTLKRRQKHILRLLPESMYVIIQCGYDAVYLFPAERCLYPCYHPRRTADGIPVQLMSLQKRMVGSACCSKAMKPKLPSGSLKRIHSARPFRQVFPQFVQYADVLIVMVNLRAFLSAPKSASATGLSVSANKSLL